MSLKLGIIGLPNVGKSTLFNALTETAQAQSANYPFCTIDPNVGCIPVPDERLTQLATLAKSAKIIFNQVNFVDIAGLVRGASQGEGLGNQFLGHIRQVDALLHVVRCFEGDDIVHVEGGVDPERDLAIIETELMLADLESLERRIAALKKKSQKQDQLAQDLLSVLEKAENVLHQGQPPRFVDWSESERKLLVQDGNLLTMKPVLYVCNVSEADRVQGNAYTQKIPSPTVLVCARMEEELSALGEERSVFIQEECLETGLNQVIRQGYALLGLITFFTVGPQEARAWTVPKGTKASSAAGVIHSDFERGFICAETISYQDYLRYQGEGGIKAAGKLRQEGRNYVVCDGDVMHFRFNV